VKNKIDKWFSDNIVKIKYIIGYWRNYHKKNFDVDEMFNDVYLHVNRNIEKIKNKSGLEAMVSNYIKDNSFWTNSDINRNYKSRKEVNISSLNDNSFYTGSDINNIDGSLERKIEVEVRINKLYDFRNTLKDPEERIYFTKWLDILQDGKKPTTRKMRDEFGIKHYQSAQLSKHLLNKLNNFLIENNYKK
jgi:hypothetical protein